MVLVSRLTAIYDRRLFALTTIKTLPFRYGFTPEDRSIHAATTVLMMYAHWEGFIKEAIAEYLQWINEQQVPVSQLSPSYYALLVDSSLSLREPLQNFDIVIKRCQKLRLALDLTAQFNTTVDTASNVNFKVINGILRKLDIESRILPQDYSQPLDRFLFFRNAISHGVDRIPVTQLDLDRFSQLVEELMGLLIVDLEQAADQEIWLEPRDKIRG
jgi:hypothetical protein